MIQQQQQQQQPQHQQQQQQLQLQAQQEEWMRQQLAQQQAAQQQALLAQQQQEYLAAQAQQQARLVPQPTAFGFDRFRISFILGPLTTCGIVQTTPLLLRHHLRPQSHRHSRPCSPLSLTSRFHRHTSLMNRLRAMTLHLRHNRRLRHLRCPLSSVTRLAPIRSMHTWQTFSQHAMATVLIRSEMLAPFGMPHFPFEETSVF